MSPIAVADAFERAPLLAERVGEGDPETVVARARAILATMGEPERIAVLNAHPRIGATAGLSERSAAEQRSHEPAEPAALQALSRLNAEYERRFGFRFVVFVNGRSRADIVPLLKERLGRAREQELATGLEEFLAIARDRLERG
ncbi:MAG TPA: 2-oxo-4-hydroxy-4-carboxy-5-ureidoimidazoline decarboxylase [Candidatus Limnocylindria bacterium]